jgi:hypothetical protein
VVLVVIVDISVVLGLLNRGSLLFVLLLVFLILRVVAECQQMSTFPANITYPTDRTA